MGDWYPYRHLREGEIIMEGDEVDVCNDGWRDEPRWVPATHGIGTAAPCPDYPSHRVYRRLKEIDRLRNEVERLKNFKSQVESIFHYSSHASEIVMDIGKLLDEYKPSEEE